MTNTGAIFSDVAAATPADLADWIDPEEHTELKATVERLAAESAKAKGWK